MTINKDLKDRLIKQSLKEITFAENYRRTNVEQEWKLNEEMMKAYGVADQETKNRVPLFQAISFEETLLSKIDNSIVFKMKPKEIADKTKAEKLNSLRASDANRDRWDRKDRVGKRHAIRYGRAIFGYKSEDDGVYKSCLFNIRPRMFYIDPNWSGNKEMALYLGWYGVRKTKWQLMDGVKEGEYDKADVDSIIAKGGNYNVNTQDENAEKRASNASNAPGTEKKILNPDVFMFYQHFTYDYETGTRYKLLLTKGGDCIVCEPHQFAESENDHEAKEGEKMNRLYPIWTWATSPDDTEFWSVSPISRVRRMFKIMEKSVGQMLDNSDNINKPKLAVNVDRIRNLASVKYGGAGFIEVTGDTNANNAVYAVQTPVIDTPLRVYDKMQMITDRESGISAQAMGVADDGGVLGIYQGNQEALGDRIGLLNKEYSEGTHEFGMLWIAGVKENLKTDVAVEMIGKDGINIEEITWATVKPDKYDYDIIVESSSAEAQMSAAEMKNKIAVITAAKGDENFNQRALREKELELTGFSPDEIRSLLDTSSESGSMVVKAHETFAKFLKAKVGRDDQLTPEILVPRDATVDYGETLLSLWQDKQNDIDAAYKKRAPAIHAAIEAHLAEATVIAEKNMARQQAMEQAKSGALIPPGTEGQPTGDGQSIDPAMLQDVGGAGLPPEQQIQEPIA